MTTFSFQGAPLAIDDPTSPLTPDVIQLIKEKARTILGSGSSANQHLSIFSETEIPEINLDDYVERRLEHFVVILTEEACSGSLKEEILKVGRGHDRKEVFAIVWPKPGKEKKKRQSCRSCSHDKCLNLVKVSELMDSNNKDERVSNMIRFLKSDNQSSDRRFTFVELDDENNSEAQFEKLRGLGKHFVLHCFKAYPFGFIWTKSVGPNLSFKTLRPIFKPVEYEEQKWLEKLEKEPSKNIILISGVAGIGKTTFLSKIANDLKSMKKHKLILFVNVKKADQILNTEVFKGMKELNVLTFLHLLTLSCEINNELEKRILKCLMTSAEENGVSTSPKVELLMDDLHLMSRSGRKLLLEYLKKETELSGNWSYRIWFATRPHLKSTVEEKLGLIGFSLDPFSSSDIEQFLINRGFISSDFVGHILSPTLQTRIKLNLVDLLSSPRNLIGMETVLKKINLNPFYLKGSDVMQILVHNVERCYCNAMNKLHDASEVEHVTRANVLLALRYFSFQSCEESIRQYVDRDILEFGLVTKNDSDHLVFVHEAYASFLVAEYLVKTAPYKSLENFFLNVLLIRDNCEEVRMFYEQLLMSGMKSQLYKSWSEVLRISLTNTFDLDKETTDHDHVHSGGNILHLAIIDQRLRIAKFIVKCFVPKHFKALRRLILRKVRVEINCVFPRNGKGSTLGRNTMASNYTHSRPRTQHCFIELSAFSLAIMFGDVELVSYMYQALIDSGSESDWEEQVMQYSLQDSYRFSPIHLAVIGCNMATLNYLSQHYGASVNKFDLYGHTPLHLVFYNQWTLKVEINNPSSEDNTDTVKRIIEIHKCFDDKTDGSFRRKLINAVADRAGQLPMLQSEFVSAYYISQFQMRKAVFHKEPGNPQRIWWYKPACLYHLIVAKLCGRPLVNFSDLSNGMLLGLMDPPFHLACGEGYLPIVKTMMDKGVEMNIKNINGNTALFKAICNRQVGVTIFLLENGIDKSDLTKEYDGIPLWHHICIMKIPKLVKYLAFSHKLDVNLKAKDGRTPLHLASSAGCLITSRLLLRYGANVDNRDTEGYTPLLRVCHQKPEKCCENVVKLLIENGADVNAQDKVNGYGPLHAAVLMKNLKLVMLLLENEHVNVNLGGESGQTPMHLACKMEGNLEMIKCLIEKGKAGVEVLDKMEQTPLMIFARSGNKDKEMALHLFEHGSTMLHHKSSLGRSPIMELETKNKEIYTLLKTMFWRKLCY